MFLKKNYRYINIICHIPYKRYLSFLRKKGIRLMRIEHLYLCAEKKGSHIESCTYEIKNIVTKNNVLPLTRPLSPESMKSIKRIFFKC